jgi:SRSO17 transposase
VSLSVANDFASLPVDFRLYVPKNWADDSERSRRAGISADVRFRTKPQIALQQLRSACAADIPRGVVVAVAAYGNDTEFREGITALGLSSTLCIAAYGFLVAERGAFPPSGGIRAELSQPPIPDDYRPRGAADTHGQT